MGRNGRCDCESCAGKFNTGPAGSSQILRSELFDDYNFDDRNVETLECLKEDHSLAFNRSIAISRPARVCSSKSCLKEGGSNV